jgi:hypothetical protein
MLRPFSSIVLALAFAPGVLAGPLQDQSAAQTPPPRPSLFSPITADRAQLRHPAAVSATARRTEYVALNLSALDETAFRGAEKARDGKGPGPEFRLDLFGDLSLVAKIDTLTRSGDGRTVSWAGRFDGQPLSSVAISVTGLVASGHFKTEDGNLFQLRFVSPGVFALHDLDEGRFPNEGQPLTVNLPEPAAPSAATGNDAVAADDGSIIDVLVVYTPAAQAAAGGQTQIETDIELAITLTNQGYAASGVIQRLRLARKEPISYTERTTTSDAFTHALQDITGTSDSFMTGIHTLRNTYAADLVSLWIQDNAFCGLAWLMTTESSSFASNGFSVVAQGGCATSNYSFAHELAHNQGSTHDRANAGTCGGLTCQGVKPYSYGYCGTTGRRTIMSYQGATCSTRFNFWSNPSVNFSDGSPTGILSSLPASADNRQSLNDTRVTVSNWRASLNPVTISVGDVTQNEGHTGSTLIFFPVTLSIAPTTTVTVNYTTSNDTAASGTDYTTRSGTLTFAAGQLSRQLIVSVTGDTTLESNETFNVTLSSPVGATINDGTGVATIVNDDAPTAAVQVSQYRLYSPITLEHLYTTDLNEYNVLGAQTGVWIQEGIGYKMLSSAGTFNGAFPVPFYRLYHTPSRQHHWTTDSNEVMVLAAQTDWTYEGIIGFLLPNQVGTAIPLFRMVLGSPPIHLWSTDTNEKFVLTTQRGWVDEGIPGYVIP